MRNKKYCDFLSFNNVKTPDLINMLFYIYALFAVINAKQLTQNQNLKLKEIAIDFGFGSIVVDCLAVISEDSVECVQRITGKWNKLNNYDNRIKVCCEKWDEYDCIIEAAVEKCRYDGFHAVYESQQLIKQLMEAEACYDFKYGSIDCIEANPTNRGRIGLIVMSHDFYIVLLVLLLFAVVFWLR